MKKFTILLACMLIFAGMAKSQMVEDFEHIPLNLMLDGETDNSAMTLVLNPDQDEATNPSYYVIKYDRSQHGFSFGGFWSALPEPVDMTDMKYVHVQVWKPRISPLKFKVEGGPGGTFEFESMEPQTLTEEWETITFHFPDADGLYPVISFMPDFEDPLTLGEDIVIYFDNIVLSDNAVPGEGDELVIENFEFIGLNVMTDGEQDNSTMTVVPNPAPDDVNESNLVVEYFRSQHGFSFGGFWSALPEPIDLTENKYIYVKVWKTRISPLRFKIEGGPTANTEVASMFPQTKVNEWEEIVFDFSEVTGTWATIVFMPDFEDPLTLDEDIFIYFDEIRVGPAPSVNVPHTNLPTANVSLFPNPARENINIRHAGIIQGVEIFDITGRSIQNYEGLNAGQFQVDVSGVNQGIYILRIVSDKGISSHKIQVSR